MQSSSEQPLVGEEHCVTTRITAAKETRWYRVHFALTFVVSEAPRILGVSSADVNLKDAVNLSCVVSSFPTSNVTWMFKGRKLQPPSAKYLFFDSVSTITILKVSFADAGLYECTLFNELGQARANASLTVGCK